MIEYILKEVSRNPDRVFTKTELLKKSAVELPILVSKNILSLRRNNYADFMLTHPCHGRLKVICDAGKPVGLNLDDPESDPRPLDADEVARYQFSIEKFLQELCFINGIEYDITKVEGGYYFGDKAIGDKKIGLVFFTRVSSKDFLKLKALNLLKDYQYIFVFAVSIIKKYFLGLEDSIVLLELKDSLDFKTLMLSFEDGIAKLRQRKVLKDVHLEITGNTDDVGRHEIMINEHQLFLPFAPFLLLLRLALGAVTVKDRWVFVEDLIKDGMESGEKPNQGVGRLKKEVKFYVDWNNFIKNGRGRYRLAPDVTEITINRQKLLGLKNGRITEIAKRLPIRK